MIKRIATSDILTVEEITATGSDQTDAAEISSSGLALVYASGANGTKGIKLPPIVEGKCFIIKNDDTDNAILKVYPNEASGVSINVLTAGAAISMAAKTSAMFVARNGSQWVTTPTVPS